MINSILRRLQQEDDKDGGLATELKLYADGSWSVERESDGKTIAQGEYIKSLGEWGNQND